MGDEELDSLDDQREEQEGNARVIFEEGLALVNEEGMSFVNEEEIENVPEEELMFVSYEVTIDDEAMTAISVVNLETDFQITDLMGIMRNLLETIEERELDAIDSETYRKYIVFVISSGKGIADIIGNLKDIQTAFPRSMGLSAFFRGTFFVTDNKIIVDVLRAGTYISILDRKAGELGFDYNPGYSYAPSLEEAKKLVVKDISEIE